MCDVVDVASTRAPPAANHAADSFAQEQTTSSSADAKTSARNIKVRTRITCPSCYSTFHSWDAPGAWNAKSAATSANRVTYRRPVVALCAACDPKSYQGGSFVSGPTQAAAAAEALATQHKNDAGPKVDPVQVLPPAMVRIIFERTGAKDISRSACVSKTWKAAARDEDLWRSMARKRIAPRIAAERGILMDQVDDDSVLRVGWTTDGYAQFAEKSRLVRCGNFLQHANMALANRERRRLGWRTLLLLRVTRGCCQCGALVFSSVRSGGINDEDRASDSDDDDDDDDTNANMLSLAPKRLPPGRRLKTSSSFSLKQRHFYEKRSLIYCQLCEPSSYYGKCGWG